MRATVLALSIVAACTRESARNAGNPGTADVPSLPAVAAPPAQPSLDSIASRLAAFDEQVDSTRAQLRLHASTPAADSSFVKFRETYLALADTLSSQLGEVSVGGAVGATPGGEDSLLAMLRRHGFDVTQSEGQSYVDEDVGHLLAVFGPLLTPAMREYLKIRDTEQDTRFSEDAGLMISWDSLSDRIAVWERFLQAYPTFSWRAAPEAWRDTYLATYLTGMDNTRTLSDSGTLRPEVRASYERFLHTYSEIPAAQVIRDFLALLAEDSVPDATNVEQFLRGHHLESMLGVQPPVR